MTKGNGLPCKKCGTSEWYRSGNCKQCARKQASDWCANNPEEAREKSRRWKRNNPEKQAEDYRNWQRANPEKKAAIDHRRRTRKTKAGGSYTAAEWKAVVKQQGGRCLACGKKTRLTADHVVPVIAGGTSDISNIQGLCKPCNSRKGTKATDYRTKPGIKRWVQKRLLG